MSEQEAAAFLAEERKVTCATVGPRGWPHLMPLWYVLREPHRRGADGGGPRLWAWTYAASQKVRNLERDPARNAASSRRASSTRSCAA